MKHFVRLLLATVLLLALPLHAQTIEERLERLEQEVRALRQENDELRKRITAAPAPAPEVAIATPAAAAPKPDVVVKPSGKEMDIAIGGLVQVQGETGEKLDSRFTDDNDRMYVRRARLLTQGHFPEKFDFRIEAEFAGGLANSSGVRAQLVDGYATWTQHPAAQIRVGQMKTPFGYEQLTGDVRLIPPERTLGSDRITLGRQLGIQLLGDLHDKRVNYAVGFFNGNGINITNNDDEGFLTVGRLGTTLWSGEVGGSKASWAIAANGFTSNDRSVTAPPELHYAGNAFAGSRDGFGADTQFISGRTEIWVEALRARYQPNSGPHGDLESWSVLGAWMVTKKLQAVARYDELHDPLVTTKTWTGGANYLIKGNDLKMQLFYMQTNENDHRVIARMQVAF